MDASSNNDAAPVTNESSGTSEISTLKLTIETPKEKKYMLIHASSTVKQLKDVAANELSTFMDQMSIIYAGEIRKDDDDLKKYAENDTTNKQASSATCSDSIEKFQLDFDHVHVHFSFPDNEKIAIYERFGEAKRFLTNLISADSRCTAVWANIIGDAYEKITELSPLSRIYQLLFTTSTITISRLQELIATKISIAIVHADAAADPSVLDAVRTKVNKKTCQLNIFEK
ncbi:unnamed protein product [Rotaria magnacalcarata]|uniref:Ubiquitin-like domain-containing protein n=1 Tax=Rotaria magnacalcarata TaxID=392030 RepID=A0A815CPR8_9BILA|nr:unnamed protein product [Rotaria magnacalcarata]CAF3961326.1 unnamed protein product [Rotaria magnacalcarata]